MGRGAFHEHHRVAASRRALHAAVVLLQRWQRSQAPRVQTEAERPELLGVALTCRRLVAAVVGAGALVVVGSIVVPPAGASRSVASARSCQPLRVHGARYRVTIEKGHVTCHTARKVLRAFLSGHGKMHGPTDGPAYKQYWTLYGWRCGHGAGGGGCIRHGKSYTTARDYIVAES